MSPCPSETEPSTPAARKGELIRRARELWATPGNWLCAQMAAGARTYGTMTVAKEELPAAVVTALEAAVDMHTAATLARLIEARGQEK